MSRRGGGGCSGFFPGAALGLGDQAHLDGLGADLDADDLAIDDGAHLLDIRLELPGGDAGDLGADAAKVFGFAAVGDLVAEGGFLAGEMTDAWHLWSFSFRE